MFALKGSADELAVVVVRRGTAGWRLPKKGRTRN